MDARPFLARAIELGAETMRAGRGGPFGAVVVEAGVVIGEGANRVIETCDPTAHAEVLAIRAACARRGTFSLAGATIYASSEPCPMCLAAIYWARIDSIVFSSARGDAARAGFDDDVVPELDELLGRRRGCGHPGFPRACLLDHSNDHVRSFVLTSKAGLRRAAGLPRRSGGAAQLLGRPVKWTETRSENMVAMTQGRAQVQHVEMGLTRDGRITGVTTKVFQDGGAYPSIGCFLPFLTRTMAQGVYAIPRVELNAWSAATNTTATAAYRGAGRPEATQMLERILDIAADELGIDPVEIRKRNFIPPEAFPLETLTGAHYDVGEYAKALEEACRVAGYDELRAEQARARAFAETWLHPHEIACDERTLSKKTLAEIKKNVLRYKLNGVNHTKEDGGHGYTPLQQIMICEQLGRATNGMWTVCWKASTPLKYGTEKQRKEFLLPINAGKGRAC